MPPGREIRVQKRASPDADDVISLVNDEANADWLHRTRPARVLGGETAKVVVAGTVAMDTILRLGAPLDAGRPALVDDARDVPGGCGANLAGLLAFLGHEVTLQSVLGDDAVGRELTRALGRRGGALTTDIVSVPGRSPRAFLSDHEGTQWIAFSPGDTRDGWADLGPRPAPWGVLAAGPLEHYAHLMVQDKVVFDPGHELHRYDAAIIDGCLERTWLLAGNRDEMDHLRERHGEDLGGVFGLGVEHVVETLGAEGCLLHAPGTEPTHVPGVPCGTFVDATGAGDAHRAGLVHGLVQGADLVTACLLGNVLGSLAVERLGALEGTVPMGPLAQRLEQAFGKDGFRP